MRNKAVRAVLVSGMRSGVGKTTVTLGLIRCFADDGRRVAALKLGPDFLDPSHYRRAGAEFYGNFDPLLQTPRGAKQILARALGHDVVVLEGAMGLLDGPFPGSIRNSSADLAVAHGLPVLLVLDGSRAAQSMAAEAAGVKSIVPKLNLCGVVLNQVASDRHEDLLRRGVEKLACVPVLGAIRRGALDPIASRHLGLVPSDEVNDAAYRSCGNAVRAGLNIKALEKMMRIKSGTRYVGRHPSPPGPELRRRARLPSVCIARDEAFNFYYADTLEWLEKHARVQYFSPLRDARLPDCDLIYLGGGFPEVYAEQLSKNRPMFDQIRAHAIRGVAIYAECGGLMYLCREIALTDGRKLPMAGVFDAAAKMHKRRQALGYARARAVRSTPFLKNGARLLGHVYHWSSLEPSLPIPASLRLNKIGTRDPAWPDGLVSGNVFASYLHLSVLAQESFFRNLLRLSKDAARR